MTLVNVMILRLKSMYASFSVKALSFVLLLLIAFFD